MIAITSTPQIDQITAEWKEFGAWIMAARERQTPELLELLNNIRQDVWLYFPYTDSVEALMVLLDNVDMNTYENTRQLSVLLAPVLSRLVEATIYG